MTATLAGIAVVAAHAESWSLNAQLKTAPNISDKARVRELSGNVVDASGSIVRNATILALVEQGTLQLATQTDLNGAFKFSAFPFGRCRISVSAPGFESKEVSVTIVGDEVPDPLRISLAVGSVKTTVTVQGREDDLVGIADSATQGTAGAKEIQERPISRAGGILETIPGVIVTQHAGGGKANHL